MKLDNNSEPQNLSGKNLKIAIVFSRFNDTIGKELLKNTVETLKSHNTEDIEIIKIPGALEIPITAKLLIKQKQFDAIIALGVVIKGETEHFELVCRESHRAIMNLNLKGKIPVIFGIITALSAEQAKDRAQKEKLNKGKEYAETAIEMALLTKTHAAKRSTPGKQTVYDSKHKIKLRSEKKHVK